MTLEQLNKKLQHDYDKLVAEGNENYQYFLTHAYKYAHYNEVVDFFDQMDEEDYKDNWENKVSRCGFNENDNILDMIYNQWLNYNHPEYYNFFWYDSLYEILEYFFNTHKNFHADEQMCQSFAGL